ncbi:hypothetical protein HQ46_01465 [Porphyromonas gulae]|nr:hypothetical protein HQ46_01465 [Porphyromonas gulae]
MRKPDWLTGLSLQQAGKNLYRSLGTDFPFLKENKKKAFYLRMNPQSQICYCIGSEPKSAVCWKFDCRTENAEIAVRKS